MGILDLGQGITDPTPRSPTHSLLLGMYVEGLSKM